jgi:hypothetical protein
MTDMQPQESDNVQPYPLDVTKLTKGQVISIAELEHILVMRRDNLQWWKRLLQLKHKIEVNRKRMGLPELTMHTHGGELVVCTDAEASQYNKRRRKIGIRHSLRAVRRNLSVDDSQLTQEEREAHHREIMRGGMLISAIRGATRRKPPQIEERKRAAPPMVASEAKATDWM